MDTLQALFEQYGNFGYAVLFGGVLLENAGIPVPGETAVLLAGFLASPAGHSQFSAVLVIGVTFVAAVLGDNLGFWLGRRVARPRLQKGKGFLFLTPKTLALTEGYFTKYGTWTIFFARFITGLRVVGALAAGTAGMPWPHFLVANSAGALAWATAMTLLGYFFGHSFELLHVWLGRGALLALGSIGVLVGLVLLRRWLHRRTPGFMERMARFQIWQGLIAAGVEVGCIALLTTVMRHDHETTMDNEVGTWIVDHPSGIVDAFAQAGIWLGGLPIVTAVTILLLGYLWRAGRPRREWAALAWALLATELIGAVLLLLLRRETLAADLFWAYGLIPMRAIAVYGMAGRLFVFNQTGSNWVIRILVGLLVIWPGLGLVWQLDQRLTEVLLEYAAGGVVLFTGVWWLEGLGLGLVVPPEPEPSVDKPRQNKIEGSPS